MSVSDRELDPPDESYCGEHGRLLPCQDCKAERDLQRADEMRER